MSNLLAVDWDSFFVNPWGEPDPAKRRKDWMMFDWGHKEAPFFIEHVWTGRASGFLTAGLPLPDLDGRQDTFWERFKISKGAKLFYADSNACAVNPRITGKVRNWDDVWLYDAHHDSGYQGRGLNERERWTAVRHLLQVGQWSCEDWMIVYAAMGAQLHVRYPQWRAWAMDGEPEPMVEVDRQVDDGSTPDVTFDRVFVCRSGAWVPPWLNMDERFEAFVNAAPVKERIDVQPGGTTPREYSQEAAEAEAVMWRELHAKVEARQAEG